MNAAWNRRTFLTALGLTSAATALPLPHPAAERDRRPAASSFPALAALILGRNLPGETSVAFYRVQDQIWTALRSVTVANARTLALHPTQAIAYIGRTSRVDDPLPRACITAVSLHGDAQHHQPLSLSGTLPNSLALSPDAQHLLAALTTGGAYNVVPLSLGGEPGPVAHRRKHTGSGPHPSQTSARPHSVLFHPGGALAYSTDFGADRLNLLEIAPDALLLRDHLLLPPGSGPTALAVHPARDRLFFVNALRGSVSSLPVDPTTGRIAGPLAVVNAPKVFALAVHPSGRFLYLAHSSSASPSSLSIWRLGRASQSPRYIESISVPHTAAVHSLHILPDQILLATESGLLVASLQPRSGLLGPVHHALRGGPVLSLALRSL